VSENCKIYKKNSSNSQRRSENKKKKRSHMEMRCDETAK
jgi:hypothetical protein